MIRLDQVTVDYPSRPGILNNLSLHVPAGAFRFVTGPSGAGKSTLLKLLFMGLQPSQGKLEIFGRNVMALSRDQRAIVRSRMGVVFQDFRLIEHMTVYDNVALPLREHTPRSEEDIRETVRRRLSSVGLEGVEELLPGELSGGMLRRAALARAIIMDPQIVLCDEPFSGLDPPNVARIEALLVSLNRERGLTLIVSSHHIASSLRMADQLVLLQDGVAITGSPDRLTQSANPRISDFLGPDGRAHAARIVEPGDSP